MDVIVCLFQVEVKRALPKEVQQQQAALRAAVAGRGMIPAIGKWKKVRLICGLLRYII